MWLVPFVLLYSTTCFLAQSPIAVHTSPRCYCRDDSSGWFQGFENECYKSVWDFKGLNNNWTRSRSICNRMYNATLPMPKDTKRYELLLSFTQHLVNGDWKYPIGLELHFTNNKSKEMYWDDGTSLIETNYDFKPWLDCLQNNTDNHTHFYVETLEGSLAWNVHADPFDTPNISLGYPICQIVCDPNANPEYRIGSSSRNRLLGASDKRSGEEEDYTGLIIMGVVLSFIAALVVGCLVVYRKERERLTRLTREAKDDKSLRIVEPNEHIEMRPSTRNSELVAIDTLIGDLFTVGGSMASNNQANTTFDTSNTNLNTSNTNLNTSNTNINTSNSNTNLDTSNSKINLDTSNSNTNLLDTSNAQDDRIDRSNATVTVSSITSEAGF